MTRIVPGFLFYFLSPAVLAQPGQPVNCANQSDTTTVISIAKRNNAYWNNDPKHLPKYGFDTLRCEWIIYSFKEKPVYYGKSEGIERKCRKYGCTKSKSVVLTIDANTMEVRSKKKSRSKTSNLRVE